MSRKNSEGAGLVHTSNNQRLPRILLFAQIGIASRGQIVRSIVDLNKRKSR
jgi:hypothetical protein